MVNEQAIRNALKAIRARLSEVAKQAEILSKEEDNLKSVEMELNWIFHNALAEEGRKTESIRTAASEKAPRSQSFRARLYEYLREAGSEGRTIHQIRSQFSETKNTTLVSTLSNLRREGLVESHRGLWRSRNSERHASEQSSATLEFPHKTLQPLSPPRVPDYEIIVHQRTGVSLASRA